MVLGFELPESVQNDLSEAVNKMISCGYLLPEEPEKIPGLKHDNKGVLYGPLRSYPVAPDLVLMWVTPKQAMLCNEAAGSCRWTTDAPIGPLGRPACSALPTAIASATTTLSLGCMGMRIFTEVSDDRLLAVVPGSGLEAFAAALEEILEANTTMAAHYRSQKQLV